MNDESSLADKGERLAHHREAQGQTGEAALIGRMAEALGEAVVIVASHADESCEYHEASYAGCSVCEAHDWIEKYGEPT